MTTGRGSREPGADFRGLYLGRILILRRGIRLSIGHFPESLGQQILGGIILVGRLGVHRYTLRRALRQGLAVGDESRVLLTAVKVSTRHLPTEIIPTTLISLLRLSPRTLHRASRQGLAVRD